MDGRMKCSECNKSYISWDRLFTHMRKLHVEYDDVPPNDPNAPTAASRRQVKREGGAEHSWHGAAGGNVDSDGAYGGPAYATERGSIEAKWFKARDEGRTFWERVHSRTEGVVQRPHNDLPREHLGSAGAHDESDDKEQAQEEDLEHNSEDKGKRRLDPVESKERNVRMREEEEEEGGEQLEAAEQGAARNARRNGRLKRRRSPRRRVGHARTRSGGGVQQGPRTT